MLEQTILDMCNENGSPNLYNISSNDFEMLSSNKLSQYDMHRLNQLKFVSGFRI